MKKIMFLGIILIIALTACNNVETKHPTIDISEFETSDELKKFSSKTELMNFLDSVQDFDTFNYYSGGFGDVRVMAMAESADSAALGTPSGKSISATDYSTTNIQVEGVDEADFIKNDGKYIYMIVQDQLLIIDAYPAEEAKIISDINLDGDPQELFVNGDKLVVFTTDYSPVYTFAEYDFMPRPIHKQKTRALVYDISDKEDPELEYDFDLKGYYQTSRMIGDDVYLIVQDNVYYYNRVIDMPVVMESSRMLVKPDVYYFDNPETNYNFNTVMSFNINNGEVDAKTFMMGYSNTIYVSEDNIYITYQKNMPYRFYESYNKERFYDVVLPLLPVEFQSEINSIKNQDLTEYEKWDQISAVLEEMYNSMSENAKENLMEEISEAITEYEVKLEEERRKTVVHKINIDKGNIKYDTRGEVKGYLLNQFSMDEFEGNLRVATTFSSWIRGDSVQYNNVYILDEGLEIKGKLEKIAPEERIYSTRFMGDRLYMVTFKQIDPFFVIDLSDPENPNILGELKIPGFSDYLHPYDENHIIGVGKETGENEYGRVTTKGVKIALFDVSDVNNPKEIDKYEIGSSGSDSEVLRDHKAFLFSKEKNLLVLPVREVKESKVYDPRYDYYRQEVWQGAYVFDIDGSGFSLKGKVSHGQYLYYENAVKRALYMDDTLYTVSLRKIKMNDLNDLEELNDFELPYEDHRYYGEPYVKTAQVDSEMVEEEVVEVII